MSNASRAEIANMVKKEVMEYYQTLTEEQKRQYKEILEQVMQAKTSKEVLIVGKPIYFAMRKNKEQTQQAERKQL